MNLPVFETQMAVLAALWPDRSPTKQTAAAYWLALQDLDDAVFKAAVARCVRDCTFYPVPAEIRRYAAEVLAYAGLMPKSANDAWAEVTEALRSWRPLEWIPRAERAAARQAAQWSNRAIGQAVAVLGGLAALREADARAMGFLRRDFMQDYEGRRAALLANDGTWMAQSLAATGRRVALPAPVYEPAAAGADDRVLTGEVRVPGN